MAQGVELTPHQRQYLCKILAQLQMSRGQPSNQPYNWCTKLTYAMISEWSAVGDVGFLATYGSPFVVSNPPSACMMSLNRPSYSPSSWFRTRNLQSSHGLIHVAHGCSSSCSITFCSLSLDCPLLRKNIGQRSYSHVLTTSAQGKYWYLSRKIYGLTHGAPGTCVIPSNGARQLSDAH